MFFFLQNLENKNKFLNQVAFLSLMHQFKSTRSLRIEFHLSALLGPTIFKRYFRLDVVLMSLRHCPEC